MSANQYSHRMLNPFHGIVNVVEIEGADAVSRDGVHWALYIQGKVDVEVLEDGAKCRIQLPDTKYGTWSLAEGLKRAPVRSVVDYAWLDALGSWLLDEVKARADAVPFPLRDHYELWLLDCDQGMPLALLESACSRDALPERVSAQWRPGQLAGQEFRAPSLALDEGSEEGVPHCELLARIVRKAAGIAGRSRWFRRDAEGRGEMLDGNPEEVGVHAPVVSPGGIPMPDVAGILVGRTRPAAG